ncbi:MAG: DNA repair protein RecO, partial [Erysipelotrichaceae bacterium]|nr:DNA repair protein RecO [Erysipelotrichaceae bacterium]
QTPYKDNDEILTVLSENYGVISLYGKGLNKIAAKNAAGCQLFSYSEFTFDYNETRSSQVLKSATLKNGFANIRQDYDLMVIASLICEIAKNLPEDDWYQLLYDTMYGLNDLNQPYLILSLFVSVVLKKLGISPEVDECVVCGEKTGIETISVEDGGFLCTQCNRSTHYPKMGRDVLYKFRLVNKGDFNVLDKLLELNVNSLEIARLQMEFFITHSGVALKSYRSFQQLK